MFKLSTYVQRRQALMAQVDAGIILFIGNNESAMNYRDNTYSFRQDSSFLYYFGLSRAGLCATLDVKQGEVIIYGDEYTIDDHVWMGSIPSIKKQADSVGVTQVKSLAEMHLQMATYKKAGVKVHFLPPYRAEHTLLLADLIQIKPQDIAAQSSQELCYAVANQRNYKTEEELVEINAAVDTSVQMHQMAMRMAKPEIAERDIFAALEHVALKQGARTSFPTIATVHGQTLHNHNYNNTLKAGDLFLVDSGAERWSAYAGDLSSTVPVSGVFTSIQKEIYELALAAHHKAVSMLKPGVSFKDIYYAAARVIVEGMKSLGLMKGNTDSALEQGAHAMFFPCGLGHMMGLDVHDMENIGEQIVGYNGEPKSTQFGLKSLRLGRELESGFVLTIEPGVYFIPELMDLWKGTHHNAEYFNYDKLEAFRHFGGIRNEEDYLITADGCQRLGTVKKPMEVEEVLQEWAKPTNDLW